MDSEAPANIVELNCVAGANPGADSSLGSRIDEFVLAWLKMLQQRFAVHRQSNDHPGCICRRGVRSVFPTASSAPKFAGKKGLR